MNTPPSGISQTFHEKPLTWVWTYRDVAGAAELGHVARYDGPDGKEVIPYFHRNGTGWKAGAAAEPRPLYGLDTLADAGVLYIVEGEKSAAALHDLGLECVTSPGGAQSPHKADWTPVETARRVIVIPDNDMAGERYAAAVVGILEALPGRRDVLVARLPDLPDAGDVVDWIQARVPEWTGYGSIPREPGDDLAAELEAAIEAHAVPAPREWTVPDMDVDPDADSWEEPMPLESTMVPPWPRDVFPEPVQDFVDAVTLSTETPPELAAMMTLAVLATTAQGRYLVEVKPGYREPLNLWTLCALPSGARKTAVKNECAAPLVSWERAKRQAMEATIHKAESDRKTLEDRVSGLRKRAATTKDAHEVDRLRQEITDTEADIPDVPKNPQLWAMDVTPENLAVIMQDNHESMALLSDEGGIFDTIAGRYSGGIPNLDLFLQAHAGSPVRVNRTTRSIVFLDRPSLTVGICPQPDVVRSLADKPGFAGRGLLARFLYAMPESNLGKRTHDTKPIPEYVKGAYHAIVETGLSRPWPMDTEGKPCPRVLSLAPDALTAWQTFQHRIEASMLPGGMLAHLTDWASKLPGAVARIAAVLHVARHAHGDPDAVPVSIVDMKAAIRMADALIAHARIAFDCMRADEAMDGARLLLGWIRREGKPAFTRRDAHVALKHRFKRAKELDGPLEVLEECDYIRRIPRPTSPKGGRPSEVYEVNPSTFDAPTHAPG